MSLELARRLLHGGAAASADVEAALLEALIRRRSLVEVLWKNYPELWRVSRRELEKLNVPALQSVRPSLELSDLPVAMCEAFFAVPVRRDVLTGTVEVAAANPLDRHMADEFSFQLGAAVRVLGAPIEAIAAAIEQLKTIQPEPSRRRPGAGRRDPRFGTQVRAQLDGGRAENGSRRTTTPGVGGSAPPPDSQLEGALDLERSLAKSKLALEQASSPDRVVDAVLKALCPGGKSFVFTVRNGEFHGNAAHGHFEPPLDLREVILETEETGVLRTALLKGYYLGQLPEERIHGRWRHWIGQDELYAAPVFVGDRPVLMLVIAGFERAFTATRRVDILAQAAGQALERIVRDRKKRH